MLRPSQIVPAAQVNLRLTSGEYLVSLWVAMNLLLLIASHTIRQHFCIFTLTTTSCLHNLLCELIWILLSINKSNLLDLSISILLSWKLFYFSFDLRLHKMVQIINRTLRRFKLYLLLDFKRVTTFMYRVVFKRILVRFIVVQFSCKLLFRWLHDWDWCSTNLSCLTSYLHLSTITFVLFLCNL